MRARRAPTPEASWVERQRSTTVPSSPTRATSWISWAQSIPMNLKKTSLSRDGLSEPAATLYKRSRRDF